MNTNGSPLESMSTSDALSAWLEVHRLYISSATRRVYAQYIKALKQFFELPLKDVRIDHVRGYQQWRSQTCGATRINAELSALQMTLKEACLWEDGPIARLYRPLAIPKKQVRQNMSPEEERRLISVAFDNPRRRLAGHCLITMANTSMGFGELRHLRRQDVFLTDEPPFVEVNGGAKNDYRLRAIPLNFLALRSMRWIVKRWEDLGGTDPAQYVLPHRARRSEEESSRPGHKPTSPPIFTEPMGHIYRAARAILKDAGLSHLDPYDMRSHFITKVLSDPSVSDQMYTEIVGHVGNAMKRRYSKQRMQNKKAVVDAMCIESGPDDRPPLDSRLPATGSPAPVMDIMVPAIQAEIARQVALALRDREERYATVPEQPAKSGRLIRFPGAG